MSNDGFHLHKAFSQFFTFAENHFPRVHQVLEREVVDKFVTIIVIIVITIVVIAIVIAVVVMAIHHLYHLYHCQSDSTKKGWLTLLTFKIQSHGVLHNFLIVTNFIIRSSLLSSI